MTHASHHTESDAPQRVASADKADAAVELHVHNNAANPEASGKPADSRETETPDVDNSAPTKRTKLVAWAVGGLMIVCAIVVVALYMRHMALSKSSADTHAYDKTEKRATKFGTNSLENNKNHEDVMQKLKIKTQEFNDDFDLVCNMIRQAMDWKDKYLKLSNRANSFVPYIVKDVYISPSVFTCVSDSEINRDMLDNGYGVCERTYLLTKYTAIEEVLSSIKSNFEWKHLYAFFSVFKFHNSISDSMTWSDFFRPSGFGNGRISNEYIIIQKLFDCESDGVELKGPQMLEPVLRSDLYKFLVTMFAKAAHVESSELIVAEESMMRLYSDWYPRKDSLPVPHDNFMTFAGTFLSNMAIVLKSCDVNIAIQLQRNPVLKTVLHLTLLYTAYSFRDRDAKSSCVHERQVGNSYKAGEVVEFRAFTGNIRNDVPCWSDDKTPLLPDLTFPKQLA